MDDNKKEKDIFDILLDENDDENVVLYNEKDEPVEFEQIAYIPFNDIDYFVLKPVKPMAGVGDDQAIVFKTQKDQEGEKQLVVETDDAVIDQIFVEYNKLYENEVKSDVEDLNKKDANTDNDTNK
jgi:hypothetical protein